MAGCPPGFPARGGVQKRPGGPIQSATFRSCARNKVGWLLVVLFGVGGFFWQTIPEIWIGQIWMGVAALLALIYIVMTMRANKATELANTGVRGRAHVLRTTQTGAYIKYQPRVKMRLPIEAPGVTPVRDQDTVRSR